MKCNSWILTMIEGHIEQLFFQIDLKWDFWLNSGIWSFHVFFCLISPAYAILKPAWSFPLLCLAYGPSCAFVRKRRVFTFSNLKICICGKLPMCSSRGRLWISWWYAWDLRMMLQLAMSFLVCRNGVFSKVRIIGSTGVYCAVRPAVGWTGLWSAVWKFQRRCSWKFWEIGSTAGVGAVRPGCG